MFVVLNSESICIYLIHQNFICELMLVFQVQMLWSDIYQFLSDIASQIMNNHRKNIIEQKPAPKFTYFFGFLRISQRQTLNFAHLFSAKHGNHVF